MAKRFEGKAALVIGAGTTDGGWGNGKACAVQFAREGAALVCVDRELALAEETADVIRGEGGRAIAMAGDATRSADLKAAVDATVQTYGRIDVLVNNVGVVVPGGVIELEEEDWDRAFAINVKSAYLAMKHAVPRMIEGGGGAVVNISSLSALRYLGKNYVAYYSSKAAMSHLTRVTAAEYADRQVRVNAVVPGFMDTPMARASAQKNWGASPERMEAIWKERAARVPLGWLGDAFDIAKAATFLASDDARFITGQNLVVDGGSTLRCP
ncbi:MAG: glucose 1-dehydrogenase [Rhodoferax sp.]|nr:glucose 1-dehydrogenase [Rhodoferax sp.]